MANFKGRALPLSDGDVEIIAGYLGCHVAAVRAVLAVESAGKGFHNGRPLILNEPHIFYRQLGQGSKRDRAVAQGLAYKVWRTKPYLKSVDARYEWLEKAMAIDEVAALRSCSWGLGQMMGFNHRLCGFASVQEFVAAMCHSEGAQLYAMARFIVSRGIQKNLKEFDWAGFAYRYNGAQYKKNSYDTKLKAAYDKRPSSEKRTPPPASEAQLMALLGKGPPLDFELPKPKPEPKPKPVPETGGVVAGAGSAIAAAQAGLPWWAIALIGVGAAVAIYGAIRFFRRK